MTDLPQANCRAFRSTLIALAYLLVAAGVLAWVWSSGRPTSLTDVAGGRVQCLSYSPPSSVPAHLQATPAAQIRRDLQHLAAHTRCVRTYSVDNGLDQVPQIARELGLKVLLGIWIGADEDKNDREIERALTLTRSHRDVIDTVIVGNEVLLRREQTAPDLRAYIRRVRAATDLPITYADVWEFWLRYREVAQEVSFVTVHMLPYWEDLPVPVERSVAHIAKVLSLVQRSFPRHRVIIGEAGWPSAGRQRAGAVPSRVNQARFFREFTRYADEHAVQYNFIEAFDQPWKRALEGTVGGAWGLFDAEGRLKFPLEGPVANDPHWQVPLAAAAAGALLWIAVIGWRWRGQRAWHAVGASALAVYSGTELAALQWGHWVAANRNAKEWLGSVAWGLSGWAVYVCATVLIVRALRQGDAVRGLPSAASIVGNVGDGPRHSDPISALLSLSRMVFMVGLSYMCLLLTIDPRYRDFPLATALLPAFGLVLLTMASSGGPKALRGGTAAEEVLLAYWLLVASIWIAIAEGLQNVQSLAWCALCSLVAGSVLWSERRAGQRQSAAQQAKPGELDPI
jgi:exo-beta-1,3-glucanase (GH17 family)